MAIAGARQGCSTGALTSIRNSIFEAGVLPKTGPEVSAKITRQPEIPKPIARLSQARLSPVRAYIHSEGVARFIQDGRP